MSMPSRGVNEKVYATEVRVCEDLINRIQLTAAGIVSGLDFIRGSIYVTVRRVLRRT
jgi:hypothetical protein